MQNTNYVSVLLPPWRINIYIKIVFFIIITRPRLQLAVGTVFGRDNVGLSVVLSVCRSANMV